MEFCYTDYIVDLTQFFKDYIVVDQYVRESAEVIRAYIQGKQSIVNIIKRNFYIDYSHLERFEALIKAWQKGFILAHNIVLLNDMGSLKLVIVEFGYLDIREGLISLRDTFSSALSQNLKI